MSYWGYHMMIDCKGCNTNVSDPKAIYDFNKELVTRIDMVAHGEPIIEFMLPGDPKQGFTLVQLITTSNICAHFMDFDRTAYLDVFSCKEFDQSIVKEVFTKYFEPEKMRVNFITRHAD